MWPDPPLVARMSLFDRVSQIIANIAIIVREYDEAIRWYCEILSFRLVKSRGHHEVPGDCV
jgi:hypothetical protein